MASNKQYSYYRLRNEGGGVSDEEPEDQRDLIRKISSWSKIRRFVGRRRRTKVRIPGLRKFLRKRKRFFTRFKVSWSKVLKRLKNGQAHMGDLFAGNYLFMQVNPTAPFRSGGRLEEYHHYGFKYPVITRNIAKNPGPMY
ncbi:hypothetical protein I3843_11G014300 [Carya illinoinensis]|uniref:Uncharacterized protein n=1 Tax=Carya illinoinensis TaxID=32201 RepID=A0A8T1P045_CARIL|nr:hypothetical protein I3760_11G014300 [Carya illinoinensis]KAG6635044.1 hypothetical protein CIPAW_11G015200 [Carya illinoinensis]KAG6686379.1 hypothetical protein I3842_11G014600 [Carya illinoinensis]KAG7954391.1 hypothetical protein I3843_11G014300 [Carya illinoinensis]